MNECSNSFLNGIKRFKKIHAIASVSLIILITTIYSSSFVRDIYYSNQSTMEIVDKNGVWIRKLSNRKTNSDGTFSLSTLNGYVMEGLPKNFKFSDLGDKWKKLPKEYAYPSSFYGDFANSKGDGCINWDLAYLIKYKEDGLNQFKEKYTWQCGNWAEFPVELNFKISEETKSQINTYKNLSWLVSAQLPISFICILFMTPSLWCLFWLLIGTAFRLAAKSLRNQ